DAVLDEALKLAIQRLLEIADRSILGQRGVKYENIRIEPLRPAATDRPRELLLLHQRAVQPRGMATDQDGLQQIERRLARIGSGDRVIGVVHQRILAGALEHQPPLAELLRLAGTQPRRA